MSTITEWQKRVGDWAKRKGWSFVVTDTPEKIALMHSELSEALEEYRKGLPPTTVYYSPSQETGLSKPEGLPMELADCVIRILHYAEEMGFDLESCIEEKMHYNESRPFRHGKLA